MSKTFAQAPKPKPLTDEAILAFERQGTGQDTNKPTFDGKKAKQTEPIRRLSIDLPESLHRRFKTACSKHDKRMLSEVVSFIKRRTEELERG